MLGIAARLWLVHMACTFLLLCQEMGAIDSTEMMPCKLLWCLGKADNFVLRMAHIDFDLVSATAQRHIGSDPGKKRRRRSNATTWKAAPDSSISTWPSGWCAESQPRRSSPPGIRTSLNRSHRGNRLAAAAHVTERSTIERAKDRMGITSNERPSTI